ncbi:MAG: OmpA family protein [Pyrinomonadaceae bacterium]
MSIFDSIISENRERFGLENKAGNLLSALLGLITDRNQGGFAGFLNRFRQAGLGDVADSWISTGDNTHLSGEQVESALGENTVSRMASQAGIETGAAKSALGVMIPNVVDRLTPDGVVPDERSLLSRIGGYLSGSGAVAETVDRVDAAAGSVGDRATAAFNRVDEATVGRSDNSILKWLLPLILLALLVAIGWAFCRKAEAPPPANTNVNVNKAVTNANATVKTADSSFRIEARDGRYTVTGVVPDQKTLDDIKAKLDAQFGAGNVDYMGLRVDANAKPFGAGWWDNFQKILPNLKDWKTGVLAFTGSAITEASNLPQAAVDQLKSLFANWKMPVTLAGAVGASKQANEEALKELNEAKTIQQLVDALNVSIINFASGSSAIPADAQPILAKAAEVLKAQPADTIIEVSGHTDNTGNAAGNQKLSQARADSVRNALIKLGVSDKMLAAKGYGDTKPKASNDTEDGRFQNRRIEYAVVSGAGSLTTTTTTNTNTNVNAGK